jgi:hypothetical protein
MNKSTLLKEVLQKACCSDLSQENQTKIINWYEMDPLSLTIDALRKGLNSLVPKHAEKIQKELEWVGFWS